MVLETAVAMLACARIGVIHSVVFGGFSSHELATRIGAVASFKQATVVKRLPKTRSGKILRGTMKKIADGVEYPIPATIDDPMILEEIKDALGILGYPRNKRRS